MWISTAYAQGAGGGGDNFLVSLMPLLLIFVIFWFFLIRPQQRKAKDHRQMVADLKRNDQVLTAGGIVGRVTKLIDDAMIQVEIADNVRVRVARSTISEVMNKSASTARTAASKQADSKDEDDAEESKEEAKPDATAAAAESGAESGKKSLFSFGAKK